MNGGIGLDGRSNGSLFDGLSINHHGMGVQKDVGGGGRLSTSTSYSLCVLSVY